MHLLRLLANSAPAPGTVGESNNITTLRSHHAKQQLLLSITQQPNFINMESIELLRKQIAERTLRASQTISIPQISVSPATLSLPPGAQIPSSPIPGSPISSSPTSSSPGADVNSAVELLKKQIAERKKALAESSPVVLSSSPVDVNREDVTVSNRIRHSC